MRRPTTTIALLCLLCVAAAPALAQTPVPPTEAETATGSARVAPALTPFVATYDAYYKGRQAGDATMQVVRDGERWRVDLSIRGDRGLAGLTRLNIQQSTVFDEHDGLFRPLSQSTVRKAILMGRQVTGSYDWERMQAHWDGDLKKNRRQPIPLQAGDMSALLINLAVIRDARPGRSLQYRFVDGGRVRDHAYQVAETPETIAVGDMSYAALKVARIEDDGDETILWVADGVPTPVRILQRKDGQDEIDLRLVEYQGA